MDIEALTEAARRGLTVQHVNLDESRLAFPDGSFDAVVLSATMQSVANIQELLEEMMRIGRRCIVSFANFAFKDLRDTYAQTGRAPKAEGHYRHEWYDTPNRRFPSILDVRELLGQMNAEITEAVYLDTENDRTLGPEEDFNYEADTAILVFSR